MKKIWEGDITKRDKAWELHYLVDWVHDWAENEFKTSICSQLKGWHEYVLESYDTEDAASQDYSSEIKM